MDTNAEGRAHDAERATPAPTTEGSTPTPNTRRRPEAAEGEARAIDAHE
jgi:hypothetical protein